MDNKEAQLRAELIELDAELQDPAIYSDPKYPKLAKRRSDVAGLVELFDEKARLLNNKAEAEELKSNSDADMQQMAFAELQEIEPLLAANEQKLVEALTPADPNNSRDVIIEIRAAAGGDESSLFAGELFRMYSRWAEAHNFKIELLN
jgi:peptide chain release factor 1